MINTLKYLVLSTEYNLFLSKYNTCVHNMPFFSDTSTWCHNVHGKTCRKMFAFAIISVIILPKILHSYITIYHLCTYITIIMRFYITIYHLS